MRRKLLALALGCLMCLGLSLPAFAAVEEVTELRIDEVISYSREDGVYTVLEDGLYGFCWADGSQLAAPAYAAAGDFHGGMAAVSLSGSRSETEDGAALLTGGRFGYVDLSGALAVPMKYSRVFPYSEDRAFAVDGESGVLVLLDRSGQELASFPEARIPQEGSLGFSEGMAVIPVEREEEGLVYLVVSTSGQELYTLTDACVDFSGGFHDGRVAVAESGRWETDENGLLAAFAAGPGAWGYRDEQGELVIDCQYDEARPFSEGLAVVGAGEAKDAPAYGLIDPAGEIVVPVEYDGALALENGVGALLRGGKWAYVDRRGRTLTGFTYDEAGAFSDGIALPRSGERLRAVDGQGRTLFSIEAERALPFSGGAAVVRRTDGTCGVCDEEGNLLVPFEYENAFHWDGFLWLKRGNLWRVYRTEDVVAAWQEAPEKESAVVGVFADVAPDAWYADAVTWATDQDVITGTGGGQFSPDKLCTTGEIITILWRAAGRPESEAENPFTDVTANHYYYQAALWAYKCGMVEGGVFGASKLCTRSQAVTYLWRLDGCPAGSSAFFLDVAPDAAYNQAVAWAVIRGITDGSGGGAFSPDGICSRGQIVTFLYRYLVEV